MTTYVVSGQNWFQQTVDICKNIQDDDIVHFEYSFQLSRFMHVINRTKHRLRVQIAVGTMDKNEMGHPK